MIRQFLRISLLALGIGAAYADQSVTSEYTTGLMKHTVKSLSKDGMTRTEPDSKHVMILRLDSMIVLDLDKKTFLRNPITPVSSQTAAKTAVKKGGVVKTRVEVTDTGETKPAFGQTARHLLVKMTTAASPDACKPLDLRVETDGWYLENVPSTVGPAVESPGVPTECVDEQQVETTGTAKAGFPVEYSSKTWQDGKKDPVISSMKVLAYSADTLDAALFDVPSGFADAQPSAVKDMARSVGVYVTSSELASRVMPILNSETVYAMPMTDGSIETARTNHYAYLLTLDQPGDDAKKASRFAKLTKAVTGEKADVHYRLVKVADGSAMLDATASGKSGSTLKTAMTIAQVAAPIAMMLSGGSVMQALFSNQAALQSLLGSNPALGGVGGMDPNLGSMAMLTKLLTTPSASSNPSGGNAGAAADEALHQLAKAVAGKI